MERNDTSFMRTSVTHPLRIDVLEPGRGIGHIGMTICPGKKGSSVYGADWDRDLASDIARLQELRVDGVLTIMDREELEMLKVPDLGTRLQAAGFRWWHLAVHDASVLPAGRFFEWDRMRKELIRFLASGQNLVIHCRGGLGRTGTFASLLLMDLLNLPPAESVKRVREVRRGAIETREQERFVMNYRSAGKGIFTPFLQGRNQDRILGCLLGGALGDAFGYAVEFDGIASIRKRYGDEGLQEPVLENGLSLISDDTQMTLFSAEGLLAACVEAVHSVPDRMQAALYRAYRDWLATQEEKGEGERAGLLSEERLFSRRAPGGTCLSALRSGGYGTREHPINDSKGCGGVMRAAPFGLVEAFSVQHAMLYGADAAALTHGHPSGYLPAGALAAMIRLVLMGCDLRTAAIEAIGWIRPGRGSEETVAALEKALRLADSAVPATGETVEQLGGGWVGEEALAIGLYAALKGTDFKEVIRLAANHSGDSDSTASIAGQLYGALHGVEALPAEWIRTLELEDVIRSMGLRLSMMSETGRIDVPGRLPDMAGLCTCSFPLPQNCPIPNVMMSCNGCMIARAQDCRGTEQADPVKVAAAARALVYRMIKENDGERDAIIRHAAELYRKPGTAGSALPKAVLYVIYKTHQLYNGTWAPGYSSWGRHAQDGEEVRRWPDGRKIRGPERRLMFTGSVAWNELSLA